MLSLRTIFRKTVATKDVKYFRGMDAGLIFNFGLRDDKFMIKAELSAGLMNTRPDKSSDPDWNAEDTKSHIFVQLAFADLLF